MGKQGLILRTTDCGAGWQSWRAACRTRFDPYSLVGQTEFRAAIYKQFSTRLTPAPHGKSAKAGFSAVIEAAPTFPFDCPVKHDQLPLP